ncbi:MAG: DUF6250 domain-containing protein [Pseudomonadota bacterium]
MSSTGSSRTFTSALAAALACVALCGCAVRPEFGDVLYSDDFETGLDNWQIEAEKPGRIEAANGTLEIDVPAGATLWFKPKLQGAVAIEFEATAVAAGGPNDQVSDLSVFWMANNPDGVEPVFAASRSGAFAQYDNLRTYYVSLGGNRNTATRFRRYTGDPSLRPLLPQHNLSARSAMLMPNRKQIIVLIANGTNIEFRRDGQPLLRMMDREPYTKGWFALRTTFSHLRIRALRVYSLD